MTTSIEGIDDETRTPNGRALSVRAEGGDVLCIHIEAADGLPLLSATIHVWRQDFARLAEVAAAVAAEREATGKLVDLAIQIGEHKIAETAADYVAMVPMPAVVDMLRGLAAAIRAGEGAPTDARTIAAGMAAGCHACMEISATGRADANGIPHTCGR